MRERERDGDAIGAENIVPAAGFVRPLKIRQKSPRLGERLCVVAKHITYV